MIAIGRSRPDAELIIRPLTGSEFRYYYRFWRSIHVSNGRSQITIRDHRITPTELIRCAGETVIVSASFERDHQLQAPPIACRTPLRFQSRFGGDHPLQFATYCRNFGATKTETPGCLGNAEPSQPKSAISRHTLRSKAGCRLRRRGSARAHTPRHCYAIARPTAHRQSLIRESTWRQR